MVVPSNNNKMLFVLNEYKTRRKYGEKRVHIMDTEVETALKLWFKRRSLGEIQSLFVEPPALDKPANSATKGEFRRWIEQATPLAARSP